MHKKTLIILSSLSILLSCASQKPGVYIENDKIFGSLKTAGIFVMDDKSNIWLNPEPELLMEKDKAAYEGFDTAWTSISTADSEMVDKLYGSMGQSIKLGCIDQEKNQFISKTLKLNEDPLTLKKAVNHPEFGHFIFNIKFSGASLKGPHEKCDSIISDLQLTPLDQ